MSGFYVCHTDINYNSQNWESAYRQLQIYVGSFDFVG